MTTLAFPKAGPVADTSWMRLPVKVREALAVGDLLILYVPPLAAGFDDPDHAP
jgi:hypothetical protein